MDGFRRSLRHAAGFWLVGGGINSEFDDLLKYAASVGASRLWQPMLTASRENAQGILLKLESAKTGRL